MRAVFNDFLATGQRHHDVEVIKEVDANAVMEAVEHLAGDFGFLRIGQGGGVHGALEVDLEAVRAGDAAVFCAAGVASDGDFAVQLRCEGGGVLLNRVHFRFLVKKEDGHQPPSGSGAHPRG